MYKNQLQELAQRSCFNLPSYACIREGPDHAPRFKASVNFNGEIFEAPSYSSTLRQAEHAAAEVALSTLSTRGPSRSSLTARVLDETGVYKNLLQETAHRAGLNLPVYTTVRSGPGHLPVFTSSVELAGMNFNGEPARTKKQAEKNTAMSAWSALKQMSNVGSLHHKETESTEEQEHVIVARVLSNFRPKDENKFSRQKEQNQVRRRNMALGYKNNKNPSLQQQHQQWRSVGQFSDFSSVFSIQRQNHQRNNSLLALASPSESTTSKILPPQTSSSTTKSNSFFLSSILEEHQRDEEEWLNGKSEIKDKPIEKIDLIKANPVFRSNPIPQRQFIPTQITTRTYGPPHPTSVAPMFTPNIFNSGGYHGHNHIAPAVQIRSVFPVCAAPPPMRSPPSQAPPPQKKEQQEIPAEVSSKLNNLHL